LGRINMQSYLTRGNSYPLHRKQFEDDYLCADRVCRDSEGWGQLQLNSPNQHALYPHTFMAPGQPGLDFPSRDLLEPSPHDYDAAYHRDLLAPGQHEYDAVYHRDLLELGPHDYDAAYHRDLLASGQHDYDASYQHQQICCNWNGSRHVGGQHMDPPQLAHEHPRMSDTHNVDGSQICPVLTSIGTGIAVGLIVKGAVPEINKQYDTHLKKHVDGAHKHIQNIHKSIAPSATATEPPAVKNSSKTTNPTHSSKATPAKAKEPHAEGACVVM